MARSFRSLKEALETGRGSERPFNCPVHDDRNASASVNVDKNVWYCFSCDASGKTQDGVHDLTYIPMLKDAPIPELPELMLSYTNMWSFSGYWTARYGREVAAEFQTGTDPVTGFPTIPVFGQMGQLYGFIKRNTGTEGPKYLYPVGLPVSRLLFNHHNVQANPDLLVLVEGASDVMALHQWPIPPSAAVVAVMGSGLHVVQADLVRALNPHYVLVAMDADEAGDRGSERSIERLRQVGVRGDVYNWRSYGVNDPGELRQNPWTQLISTTVATGRTRRSSSTSTSRR
jgi:5S rRNA maturation endonuclease (ribonuclease M5)